MSVSRSKGSHNVASDTLAAIIIGAQKRGTSLKSKPWLAYLAGTCLLLGLMGAALWFASPVGRHLRAEVEARSTRDAIRYLQRRLEGHESLEWLVLPALNALQRLWERPPPPGPLPTLGKGQQATSMADAVPDSGMVVRVNTADGIATALLEARPGTHIVIEPGRYTFAKTLRLGFDGQAQAPIVLSAIRPGSVHLEFSQISGIQIDRPHWLFENLNIVGACKNDHTCEHAFHVVGRGAYTTLRNNHLQDFNAHIKVNGLDGNWPDRGLVAFNTLTNSRTRQTNRPVVMLDIVGAHHWKVQDNLVTNFAKALGNRVSYGLFMKGASEGGRIERNLVICSPSDISRPGVRVGISFGGGGTDPGVCRSNGCREYEHRHGLGANNVVAHCNDAGMDVNRAQDIVLAHNTLINTSGFSMRHTPAHVHLIGNLYEGNTLAREAATFEAQLNLRSDLVDIFVNPDALLLQWLAPPETIPSWRFVTNDFRGTQRQTATFPGALGSVPPVGSTFFRTD